KVADDYDAINFRAVKSLVDCLARQKWRPLRFLFASSLAAAGPSVPGVRKTESDVCDPVDDYGRAKLAAEIFLRRAPVPTPSCRAPRSTARPSPARRSPRSSASRTSSIASNTIS